jgi:hypothetical protein
MLSSQLTLNNRAGTDTVFNEIVTREVGSRMRIKAGSTAAEPELIQVAHTASGSGANVIDRHLLKWEKTLFNDAGKAVKATINVTIATSRVSPIPDNDIKDGIAYLISLLSDGAFSATSGFAGTTNLEDVLVGGG